MHIFLFFVAFSLLVPTKVFAQIVKGGGFKLEGIDYRDSTGVVFNKLKYNKIYLRFTPLDNNEKTIDLSGDIVISGDWLGAFVQQCPLEQQFLIYRSANAERREYTCPEPAQVCVANLCVKNTKHPSTVITSTSFTRKGNHWQLHGTAHIKYNHSNRHEEHAFSEEIDLEIEPDGGCRVRHYLMTDIRMEKYLEPSPYDPPLPPQPVIFTKESSPGVICRFYLAGE